MKSFTIKLSTIKDVQSFVATVTTLDSDFDLVSFRFIVDAKSILGIFSLDLDSPLELKIYSCTDEIVEKIKPFIIE